jgi:hypothetical protein
MIPLSLSIYRVAVSLLGTAVANPTTGRNQRPRKTSCAYFSVGVNYLWMLGVASSSFSSKQHILHCMQHRQQSLIIVNTLLLMTILTTSSLERILPCYLCSNDEYGNWELGIYTKCSNAAGGFT